MRYAFNCNREQDIALMMLTPRGAGTTDKDVFIVKPINLLLWKKFY